MAEGVANKAHTIYPGAYFNEHVLYSTEAGALFTAIAEEDCVLLRLSHDQRQRMQYLDPHHAYQLLLSVFKQVEMRQPARRHHVARGRRHEGERMLQGPTPTPSSRGDPARPALAHQGHKGSPKEVALDLACRRVGRGQGAGGAPPCRGRRASSRGRSRDPDPRRDEGHLDVARLGAEPNAPQK